MGFYVWNSVVSGYIAPKRPPKSTTKKELKKNNIMTMDAILDGLWDFVKARIGQCTSDIEL